MNYASAIQYLFGLQRFGIKLGLHNITRLLQHLGNPHRKLNCVHVAGSNGKGSTCALLHAILQQAGYRAGLYTSPHLIDFTERIRIGGSAIPRGRVAALTADLKKICERKSLATITFFEFATAMAFLYFQQEQADPVVIETGLGGRYDATNVIRPLVSVITTISREHQQYLGRTLRDIALEKAGIIKQATPLISGVGNPSINGLFGRMCRAAQAPLYYLGRDVRCRKASDRCFSYRGLHLSLAQLRSGLIGAHQTRNAALAIAAAELLAATGYAVQPEHIREGIARAHWPGRMEILRRRPTVLIDGAHNPEGWRILRKTIRDYFTFKRLVLVLGVMQDKDIGAMLKILTPGAYAIILCRPAMSRAASREIFADFIRFSDRKNVFWHNTSAAALRHALALTGPKDLICAAGSLFLAGELRELYDTNRMKTSGRIRL